MTPTFLRALALGAAILGGTAATASAGALYIDTTTTPGSTAFSINQAGGSGAGWGIPIGTAGFVGSANLDVTQPGFYSFQYLGAGDSTDQNEFFVNGNLLFCSQAISGTCAQTPLGATSTVFIPSSGEVNYTFVADHAGHNISLSDSSTIGNVPVNGGNFTASVFTGCVTAGACTLLNPNKGVYLGLSDEAGNLTTGDHDFQDLGVVVKAVPEPASVLLLAAGLSALGLARRRQRGR